MSVPNPRRARREGEQLGRRSDAALARGDVEEAERLGMLALERYRASINDGLRLANGGLCVVFAAVCVVVVLAALKFI